MSEIKEFVDYIDTSEIKLYDNLLIFMKELGYKVKRAKTKDINYVFTNSKTKRHILKLSITKERPVVKLKFYASNDYSNVFNESIRLAIEEFDFKYTGCYGCGKCDTSIQGYKYLYDDGREYFRCGNELIELVDYNKDLEDELFKLIMNQHEYYLVTKSRV